MLFAKQTELYRLWFESTALRWYIKNFKWVVTPGGPGLRLEIG